MSNSRIGKNGGATLVALIDFMCAIEIAPPFVMLSETKHLVIASEQRERGNRQAKNPKKESQHIKHSNTFDGFANARNDKAKITASPRNDR